MALLSSGSPEKAPSTSSKVETGKLIVMQPARMRELKEQLAVLDSIENLGNKVSERSGEDRSGDWSGAAGATGGKRDDKGTSRRATAIAAMPQDKGVLRERLTKHIEHEVHALSKLAKAASRSRKAGAAYKVNDLYARIRRLNALLTELLEASVDFLKKLFIRVFIDEQSVL